MKKDKVAFFHLYNDYSGSPKVLCNVIEGLLGKYSVRVITSNSKGVLDELAGNADVEYDYFNYQPTNNKIVCDLDRRVDSPALSGRGSRPSGRTSG